MKPQKLIIDKLNNEQASKPYQQITLYEVIGTTRLTRLVVIVTTR